MKISFSVYLFLGVTICGQTSDDVLTDSYEDCLKFATNFQNTCPDTASTTDFDALRTSTVTCDLGDSYCPTNAEKNAQGECTYKRKLCVTCRKDGE